MRQYESLVDALEDLRLRGYLLNFNLESDAIHCADRGLRLSPEEFQIREFYRFEGMNDPDDSSILYAIEGPNQQKGVFVSAYGVYSEGFTPAMAAKLTIVR